MGKALFQLLTSKVCITREREIPLPITAYLQMFHLFPGSTCGLCGNLNDNQGDDFITPQGLPETLPNDFGDTWKVEPSCADTHVIEHPCKTNKHRSAWAHKTCNIIRRDVFKPCHEKVSVL